MTITLNPEQREAIESHAGGPLYVLDAEHKRTYVLVSAEAYQRIRALLGDDEFEVSDAYAAQSAAAGAAGWDDPEMDAYNEYDKHRSRQ